MVFDRLHAALGEEKFQKILNALMRGEPARTLARQIQLQSPEGWGDCQGVPEKTLAQQLNRLRLAAAEGAFGPEVATQIAAGNIPQHIAALRNVSIKVFERLEELSDYQRLRLLTQIDKERLLKQALPITNDIVAEYRKVLMDLQKIRFDLGLDEFKGPVGSTTIKGGAVTQTFPDGTSVQKQIFEAVSTVEQIFNARKIPHIFPVER